MYKVKRFSRDESYTTWERVKLSISHGIAGFIAGAIPGTLLGALAGGILGAVTGKQDMIAKGALAVGGAMGLLKGADGAQSAWLATSDEAIEARKRAREEIMERKRKKTYPKEDASKTIKAIDEMENKLGIKFSDQLHQWAKIQAKFNNTYFKQWDLIDAYTLGYFDWIPNIVLDTQLWDKYGFMILSTGQSDHQDILLWKQSADQYGWYRMGGLFGDIKSALLSFLTARVAILRNAAQKDDYWQPYYEIVEEYKNTIQRQMK